VMKTLPSLLHLAPILAVLVVGCNKTANHPVTPRELEDAIKDHNVAAVAAILKADPKLANSKDAVGSPVLHSAVFWAKGRTEVVTLLLDHGADVNGLGGLGISALHDAVRNGRDLPVATVLLDRGADVNIADQSGRTPLMVAASVNLRNRFETMSFLLDRGAVINVKDRFGRTALDMLEPKMPDHARVLQLVVQQGGKSGNEVR
jgi:uncharacterized protein